MAGRESSHGHNLLPFQRGLAYNQCRNDTPHSDSSLERTMPLILSGEANQSLQRFLVRRNLKEPAVQLLERVREANDLQRGDLSVAKNQTYETLVANLIKAINQGWMDKSELVTLLDESEISGRQHIVIYRLPTQGKKAILDAIVNPQGLSTAEPSIDDFCNVPNASTARIIRSTDRQAIVKIVRKRHYWMREVTESSATDEWIHRWVEEERSAIVLHCDLGAGLLQIRVPPREKGQSETAESVYLLLNEALDEHYPTRNSWFDRLRTFPITDAFASILSNRTDFVLRYDSPESETVKSLMSRKGSIKELEDLRDDPMWNYESGFARPSIRGAWLISNARKTTSRFHSGSLPWRRTRLLALPRR